ncbi:MAG: HEAT repeat domain-containing protein [Anaerolineae bacterium]|nr:HEAT repeat domain-containing protein [Anaerolineae bacterium]
MTRQFIATTRARLSRTVDTHYREAVIQQANSRHVAGHLIPLEQIAVVPRFYTLPQPYNPLEEEPEGYNGPFNLLPITPDWPQVIAPYQLPGIPLDRVLRGPDNIAVLGPPGSGRSAALALMAILAARQKEDNQPGGLLDTARMPILIHLADVDLAPETWGAEVDPLDPALAAGEMRMKGLATSLLKAVQKQFATGYGLILVDGWEDLPLIEQRRAIEWLRILIATYPDNKVVVTGPVQGYKPLHDLGLAPTFIVPWSQPEFNELGHLWAAAWPTIGGTAKEPAPEPEADVVRRSVRANRSRTPLDVTLKIWAAFANDDPGMGRRGWYSAYIDRVLPAPELRSALERIGERTITAPDGIGASIEEVTRFVDGVRDSVSMRTSISTPDFVYEICNQTLLLTEHINMRLTFNQPVIAAYLAAENLRDMPLREPLLEGGQLKDLAISFLAQMQDITPYVERRLAEKSTILEEKLLPLGLWTADAAPGAAWRAQVFKRLAQILLSPAEFPLVRERATAALVASRDPNVVHIFRQGLKNQDPRVRMLSAVGMGAVGDPECVTALGEALNDDDATVVVVTALALGAVSTKPALDYLIQALLTGIEMARRAAAEMLGTDLLGEGHKLLQDAIKDQDPMTRRAAVFGLERVGGEWVIPLLNNAERHDDQWLVRAAATAALETLKQPPDIAPRHRPRPEEIAWLDKWLSERDQEIMSGSSGISQIVRILQEGDDPSRLAAAETLGAIAAPEGITPLYTALRDGHAEVRDAAYRALGGASIAFGRDLPGVM